MDRVRDALKRDEGERLHLYYDHGVPHIGVGANLMVPVPADLAEHITITPEASDALLDARMHAAAADLYRFLPWTLSLDEVRQGALIQIVYNMGINNLVTKNKSAVASIERGEYEVAKRLLLGDTWERQIGQRAVRLCNQLVTGVWT